MPDLQTTRRVVVFTDLDATLLDHHDYSWSAAVPALDALAARDIPVCICTSKTVAEIKVLRRAMGNHAPFAGENGSVVAVPRGYFDGDAPDADDNQLTTLGASYADLRALAVSLREQHGYRYQGFGDMSVSDVVAATGLDASAGADALQRHASEPLLWQDSEAAEQAFAQHVAEAGYTTRRGGRFVHLLGRADKADALAWLRKRFEALYGGPILAVALGDSANDADMLDAADIGIWIQRPDGHYQGPAAGSIRHAPAQGPAGWAAAIRQLIEARDI